MFSAFDSLPGFCSGGIIYGAARNHWPFHRLQEKPSTILSTLNHAACLLHFLVQICIGLKFRHVPIGLRNTADLQCTWLWDGSPAIIK